MMSAARMSRPCACASAIVALAALALAGCGASKPPISRVERMAAKALQAQHVTCVEDGERVYLCEIPDRGDGVSATAKVRLDESGKRLIVVDRDITANGGDSGSIPCINFVKPGEFDSSGGACVK